MTSLIKPTERFRSATDFPKTVEHLDASDVNQLYVEMRDCLIFTNRSRSRLIRRNEEHEQTILTLQDDVDRLQKLIHQLSEEKQALVQRQQSTIATLEQELNTMLSYLGQVSQAFREVEDITSLMEGVAIPDRLNRFWQASKVLVDWWQEENDDFDTDVRALLSSSSLPSSGDRQEKRQVNTTLASVQRLAENPSHVFEGSWVRATSVRSNDINLESQGIDKEQAESLRASLATFSDDWDSPEMSVYDNYDAAKANR